MKCLFIRLRSTLHGFRGALALLVLFSIGAWGFIGWYQGRSGGTGVHTAAIARPTRVSVIEDLRTWGSDTVARAIAEGGVRFGRWYSAQTSGICEAHGIPMQRAWLRMSYGFPGPINEDEEEAHLLYPYADEGYVSAGCANEGVQEEEYYVCDACTAGFKRYVEVRNRIRSNGR